MKRGNLKHWTAIDDCSNLLFFSQLVNELLFDYSIPSNRISTLNTRYLCLDAMNTIYTIERKGVPEGTLKPIVEELFESISNDIALSYYPIEPLSFFVKQNKEKYVKSSKPSDLSYEESKSTVEALYQLYFSNDSYYESLKTEIIKIILDNKTEDQPKLFRLTKSLLTELVNSGYSAPYIFDIMNRNFWNAKEDISVPNKIDDFFNAFSFEKSNFDVVFVVDKNKMSKVAKFIERIQLDDSLDARFNSKSELRFLDIKEGKAFLTIACDSFDPFSAQKFAIETLLLDIALYKLYDHNFQYDIKNELCGIYDESQFYKKAKDISAVAKMHTPSNIKISNSLSTTIQALDSLIEYDNNADFRSILNAIQFHSHSLSSIPAENQLLDLWSIFESVLNISNKHTADRIQQICKYLVPILKRNYIYSLISQLSSDIKNYSEDEYKKITDNATDELSIIKKVFEFVSLDENASERNLFLSSCSDYPLLVERINYYNQVFSTTKTVYDFIEKHARRVRWQVMRIYRNRNLIIHNGESMPYLSLLVENLHSYVDDFLSYAFDRVSEGNSIDSMCQELFVKECIWENCYSPNKGIKLTKEHTSELLTF